jgi:hypothetical protein
MRITQTTRKRCIVGCARPLSVTDNGDVATSVLPTRVGRRLVPPRLSSSQNKALLCLHAHGFRSLATTRPARKVYDHIPIIGTPHAASHRLLSLLTTLLAHPNGSHLPFAISGTAACCFMNLIAS